MKDLKMLQVMQEELVKRDKRLKGILVVWLFVEIAIILRTLTAGQEIPSLIIAAIIVLLFGLYLTREFAWQEKQKNSLEKLKREQEELRNQICKRFGLEECKYTQVVFANQAEAKKYPTYRIFAKARKEKLILFAYSKTKRFGWFVELYSQEDWQEFSENFRPFQPSEFQLPKFL